MKTIGLHAFCMFIYIEFPIYDDEYERVHYDDDDDDHHHHHHHHHHASHNTRGFVDLRISGYKQLTRL